MSNPNYKVISGSCYYFENTSSLNYDDAQLNCQDKFANFFGGLFEPRLASTNQLVYAEAINFISANEDDFWLGINDLANQGQYVYASDGQAVDDGMWTTGQPSNPYSERCVVMVVVVVVVAMVVVVAVEVVVIVVDVMVEMVPEKG